MTQHISDYFLGKLKVVKKGAGTLRDKPRAAWPTTNGGFGAHDSTMLPLILCGGSALGLKHQGRLVQMDVPLANVWKTVANRVGMPTPDNFQGGQAKRVINEII